MQPWLSLFDTSLCDAVLHAVQRGEDCLTVLNSGASSQTLKTAKGLPLRFVPHNELPAGMAYEAYIDATGCVPTRSTPHSKGALHDACNALMWLHFPRSKSELNALQASAIAADGVQGTRGALRDALTLFDESALILCCPQDDAAPQWLAQRQWRALLVDRRSDWGAGLQTKAHNCLQPLLFGHAVLQKLQTPYPAITAQVWVLQGLTPEQTVDLNAVDQALAASLRAVHAAHTLTPQALLPLPVLGIPHWWAANADARFYDNAAIFRPLAV